jgi:hypothetical protein
METAMSIALHSNTSPNNVRTLPKHARMARFAGGLFALVFGIGLLLFAALHVPASDAEASTAATVSTAAADSDIHAPDMPAAPVASGYLPGRFSVNAGEPGEAAPTF